MANTASSVHHKLAKKLPAVTKRGGAEDRQWRHSVKVVMGGAIRCSRHGSHAPGWPGPLDTPVVVLLTGAENP